MFVRKKINKSGLVSIQVIDKSSGHYKIAKTIGSSKSQVEIAELFVRGQEWIHQQRGQSEFDFEGEQELFEKFIQSIDHLYLAGTDLLLGKIFEEIGFNCIRDEIFRYLVIYRLCFPSSKLRTTEYLYRYHQLNIDEDRLYRYMDKLYSSQKAIVQQVSYEHTLKILNDKISIVFYDVTTVYFEIDQEDDLRKTGFSKEGKHQHPQIVLGLLVSAGGYPIAYDIFEGNKFEGHTMLPIIESFQQKYKVNDLVIIADSGMLNQNNVNEFQAKGYSYIIGARIKNEKKQIQEMILKLKLKNGESQVLQKDMNTKLIISYSESRANKDRFNRERGLKKLEKQIKSGNLSKSSINNRGYNKYLHLEGEIKVTIDKNKFEADSRWDGLKGYSTNTALSKEEIIDNYKSLWAIEKAFRIAKTDLKIRPIYHFKQRRIDAHICITFVAYKVYKELERQLKLLKSPLSPEKAIEIAKTIFKISVSLPSSNEKISKVLLINDEQKNLAQLFNF